MSNVSTIFECIVSLNNGETLKLCFSSFNDLCYHLQHLNKSIIKDIYIKPISVGDMRQGRYN